MFKKIFNYCKEFIKEEYRFLICMSALYIICTAPVNYYIVIGGGTSDVDERIEVSDGYEGRGSFNIAYVSELKGTVLTYALSYVIPLWERESINDYKYSENDDYEDIDFRGNIDLKTANGSAIKTAYSLANKKATEVSSKIYVIAVFDEYESGFEVQDQLISIDGATFSTIEEYSKLIQKHEVSDKITAEVIRDGKKITVSSTIYEEDNRKICGIALQNVKEYETDPKVKIAFKDSESGPSGGLITTLEIYNQLTKKDITGGLKIVGTGTVDPNGNVGPIGGVKYKVMAADQDKADVFLVPAGDNYQEAAKVKKDKKLKIKLIPVKTVEEAIDELAKLK